MQALVRLTFSRTIFFGSILLLLCFALANCFTLFYNSTFVNSSEVEGDDILEKESNFDHAGLVGSKACSECHSEIFDTYTKHPMWNSTIEVSEDDSRPWNNGDRFWIKGKKRVLSSTKDPHGNVLHSESMFDKAGKLIYEQPYRMDYVVGSGQRAKAYIRQVEERLYVSPLNWYAQGELWGLAPGYRLDDIRRFQRRATEDCLGCHTGFPHSLMSGSDRFANPPFHERSIGCERCHGPGAGHVAAQTLVTDEADLEDQIVNPAKLTIEQREAVCYQCHLEARARVLRPGKSHLDFMPGMVLSDVWAIVDFGTEVNSDGETRSVNHVQQMRDSTCFIKSEKQMGCISCHDPHSTPSPEQKVDYYRSRCNECHNGQSERKPLCADTIANRELVGDDCTSCHMPSLQSTNMAHVAQTDHRVLRRPSKESVQKSGGTTLTFFDNHGDRFTGNEKERNLVLGTIIHCQRRGIPIPESVYPFLLEISKSRPDDAPVFAALGALAQSKNEIVKAREFYRKALDANPDLDAALDGLFDIAFLEEDWRACVEYSEKLLLSEPRYCRVIAMRGEAFARLGDLDRAIAEWEKAVEIDPGFELLRQMLFQAYTQKGEKEKAAYHASFLEKLQTASMPSDLSK